MAVQGSGLQTQIPKLLGQNYYHWHIQMQVLLESQDLWATIETGCRELPTNATEAVINEHKENTEKDRKALHILFQATSETVFELIVSAKSAKEAWDTLHKAYRGGTETTLETIEEYFNRITAIVNQLRMNKEQIEEQRIIEKILRTLTRKFESVVVAVEESKDVTTISTEELMGILQSHELRLKQYDTQSIDQAFHVHNTNPNGYYDRTRNPRNFNLGREREKREVRTGDDKRLEVLGCGEVSINLKGKEKTIPNVFYVKGLRHNLLSVGQLLQKGYNVFFANGCCEIKDHKGYNLAKVRMTGNKMFPLNLSRDINLALSTTIEDNSTLWHHRYGHVNYDTLRDMSNTGAVKGLPTVNKIEQVCEGCALGKHSRKTIPRKASWRAGRSLELVHSDIYRGGEYCSQLFQNCLNDCGIHHQLTTSYTPQQNGVAERKNRTIMEMSRSMLKAKGISNSYWGEAIACADTANNTQNVPFLIETDDNGNKHKAPVRSLNNVSQRAKSLTSSEVTKLYRDAGELSHTSTSNFVFYTKIDPQTFEEAQNDDKWIKAMDSEMDSILKNKTWELVEPPQGHKAIGVKWIYKTKYNENGEVDKYKERLVVKGYKQKHGIDYQEVFAPVIRFETVRLVIALAAQV
ncbi:hypothetical protein L1987_09276 [Smallanthus sonchifolius]|uniref:Uncharacterized protein n=1 Tax=Smallanthus sonchifolius TaxID=185202 RepID=A0ACB9JNG1_9ASTR|nr:hypothetical protein L1987_09276 [Smallanthus sonchifolius]